MLRLTVLACLLTSSIGATGCRMSIEPEDPGSACKIDMTYQPCLDAEAHSDLTWIQANIFARKCVFSGCHSASGPAAGLNLSDKATAYGALVNKMSTLETSRKLVVPNDINASYFMVMVHDIDPPTATPPAGNPAGGFMPKGDPTGLCCQMLDALERWVMAGAPNN